MSKLKEYEQYHCKDCDLDFILKKQRYKRVIHCPLCADRPYVEKVCSVWMERSFRYRKYWTAEEDEIILTGKKLGYSERRIAESLPDRSFSGVRNRWSHLLQKRKREESQ